MIRSIYCAALLIFAVVMEGACTPTSQSLPKLRPQGPLTWEDCISLPHTDPQGNGTKLLGIGLNATIANTTYFVGLKSIDATSIVNKDGLEISGVQVSDHNLTGALPDGTAVTGAAWTGATLQGVVFCLVSPKVTFPVTLRIAAVAPADPQVTLGGTAPSAQFSLQIARAGTSPVDACVPLQTGAAPGNTAFPVSGYWDDSGTYTEHAEGGIINFACQDHGVVKCLAIGYPMHDSDVQRTELFAACTRAMRADYCGAGVSFTCDGTPLTVRDSIGISPTAVPDASQRVFEAAWTGEEMFCMDHVRMPIPADAFSQSIAACALPPRRACHAEAEAQQAQQRRPLLYTYSSRPAGAPVNATCEPK